MKRFTILLLSLMTLGMYAQNPTQISTNFGNETGIYASDYTYGIDCPVGETVLFSAEKYDKGTIDISGVWTAGETEADKALYEVVENTKRDGINNNAKCLKVTCRNTDGSIGINFSTFLGGNPFLQGRRRISMLFKAGPGMGTRFYAKMQLETKYEDNPEQKYALGAYYDATEDNPTAGHDGWKRLYFDFTPYNQTDNNNYGEAYHRYVIGEYPYQLVFTPKRYEVEIGSDGRTINKMGDKITFTGESEETFTGVVHCEIGDVYYIDDIRIEDLPYAEGYWIHDDTNLPKGNLSGVNWISSDCKLPKLENGVLRLSGTWLKGMNLVNPEIWEEEVKNLTRITTYWPWNYEFNEYRDLSWHVNSNTVKLMVFKDDSQLRWPDRGGLIGTNSEGEGYPPHFIDNLNVLIFAEKSCVRPDEGNNLDAHWHDTNAVIHYKDGDIHYNGATGDIWEAWDLELTDNYPFLNPQQFTALNTIKLHRTMKPGFNTITYPFYVTAAELQSARVGSLYFGMNDENLLFVTASQTEPNVPYITDKFTPLYDKDLGINVTEKYQEIHLSAKREVHTVDENYEGYSSDAKSGKLYGTYKRISGKDLWTIVTDGSWQGFMKGGPESTIKPFRGYLTVLPNAASAGARSLSILDDDATGMGTGMVNGIETVETIHDLQGRAIKAGSLSSLPKGIYIINGKKTMIK